MEVLDRQAGGGAGLDRSARTPAASLLQLPARQARPVGQAGAAAGALQRAQLKGAAFEADPAHVVACLMLPA